MTARGGRRLFRLLPALVAVLATVATAAPLAAQSSDDELRAVLGRLRGTTYAEKEAVVDQIVATGHRSVLPILTALLEDRLYERSSDQAIVIVRVADESLPVMELVDPVSQQPGGTAPPGDLGRIGTNNRLRRFVRTAAARFGLSSADPSVRAGAVIEMRRSLDDATVTALRDQAATESDSRVRREIDTALALAALDGTERTARLQAIETLSSRLHPDVRNRLAALLEQGPDERPAEPDEEVRGAAAKAIDRIDRWRSLNEGVETLFFGLSLGSVLVLSAIGLAITFGVMGVINMAHGELMMLGAYTTYVVQLLMPEQIGASVLVAIPAAFAVAALVGVILEQTIIRFLYGRALETLLATFGVSLILQQLVRSLFSANNRAVQTPAWLSGTIQINDGLALTLNRIYIVAFTAIVFAILLLVLKRTRLGLDIRAVTQNRAMARAIGINSGRVDALTFALGSGIAGVAGVALSQLTNVGPNLGQSYIIDSFMVVVFGGVGNLWGTMIGGLSLGIVNKLLEPYAGAVLGKIVVLVALILFIQRRPRGLFPQTGRAAEAA
jgi:urea transport system permease protein